MGYLAIAALFVAAGWFYGVKKVIDKAPPLPHDPPPPGAGLPQIPGVTIPTQFVPGVLPPGVIPAPPGAPPSVSPGTTIEAGDTVIVDIAKAGTLPPQIQGTIPMFVMSLDVPGDLNKQFILCSFVRPELMVLGEQHVLRAACRKAV
jgi:hypothetical protein